MAIERHTITSTDGTQVTFRGEEFAEISGYSNFVTNPPVPYVVSIRTFKDADRPMFFAAVKTINENSNYSHTDILSSSRATELRDALLNYSIEQAAGDDPAAENYDWDSLIDQFHDLMADNVRQWDEVLDAVLSGERA